MCITLPSILSTKLSYIVVQLEGPLMCYFAVSNIETMRVYGYGGRETLHVVFCISGVNRIQLCVHGDGHVTDSFAQVKDNKLTYIAEEGERRVTCHFDISNANIIQLYCDDTEEMFNVLL